jgi:hypothetical protein
MESVRHAEADNFGFGADEREDSVARVLMGFRRDARGDGEAPRFEEGGRWRP